MPENTNPFPTSQDALQQVDNAVRTSIHIQNQAEIDRVNHRAELDRISRDAPFVPASTSLADKGKIKKLKNEVEELKAALTQKDARLVERNARLIERDARLAEKDALILEWMHSNEAFKRLAKQYGKKLGVNDDQRIDDTYIHVEDIAEEDPKFAATKIFGRAKEHSKARIK